MVARSQEVKEGKGVGFQWDTRTFWNSVTIDGFIILIVVIVS